MFAALLLSTVALTVGVLVGGHVAGTTQGRRVMRAAGLTPQSRAHLDEAARIMTALAKVPADLGEPFNVLTAADRVQVERWLTTYHKEY